MAKPLGFLTKLYRNIPGIRELIQIRHSIWELTREIVSLKNMEATRLLDFDLQSHPRYGDKLRLLPHAFQVCSQNGEDGMIREVFHRIGTTNKTFLEIGVGDGGECNTAFLLSQGWSGFWIDGAPDFVHTRETKSYFEHGSLKGLTALVSKENIGAILEELKVPHDLDLLSIDIDQNTYYVWEAMHAYRPRVVVIEYNASIPPDMDWKVSYHCDRSWDGSNNYGASLKALELLGRTLGYSLIGCDFTGINAIFVRQELIGDHFSPPYTAENHYEPPRYGFVLRRGHSRSVLERA